MKKLILVFAAIAITASAYTQFDSTYKQVNPRNVHMNQNHQDKHNNPFEQSLPDGVMIENGKVMLVKNEQLTTLGHNMTMGNGTIIMTDGNYIEKDGTRNMLKEGQHMDMEGKITFIKENKDRDMYLLPDSIVPDSLKKRDS